MLGKRGRKKTPTILVANMKTKQTRNDILGYFDHKLEVISQVMSEMVSEMI